MQIFRRVVLPIAYLLVLAVIAVSLAWLAFKPADSSAAADEFPTGALAGSEVMVERGTVESLLNADGTIAVADPVAVRSTHTGVVNHIWASPGAEVLRGAQLFQIRVDEMPEADPGDAGPAADPDSIGDLGDGGAETGEAPRARPTYHTVVAPTDGTVGSFELVVGDETGKGDEPMSLAKREYSAVADIDPVELYRIEELPSSATITITGGPEPFECTGLRLVEAGAPPANSQGDAGDSSGGAGSDAELGDMDGTEVLDGEPADDGASGTTQLRCAVPSEVKVYNGLRMSLGVQAGSAEDVLLVPVTAVRGLGEQATVWVLDDMGEPQEREVAIGLSDGAFAEVSEGVEEGELILKYVPGTEPEDDFGFVEEEW